MPTQAPSPTQRTTAAQPSAAAELGLLADPRLREVFQQVVAGERLSREQALYLYETPDLLGLGAIANWIRTSRHGDVAYYVINRHINPTNICVYTCSFCAFARRPGEDGGYEMSVEQVMERAAAVDAAGATEVHLVGGLHPKWSFDHFVSFVSTIKQRFPRIHVKAFTAVEIAYLARKGKISIEETLQRLMDAGLGSLPGGGAEILHPEVRKVICDAKHKAIDWINVHRIAHGMGLRSTATMLYGHIEKAIHRVDHLMQIRDLQDETGGFTAFIPLHFHPVGTPLEASGMLRAAPQATGADDLRNLAVARIVLDNFEHIKAYWIMIGMPIAQVSLSFGVDDIDGTVEEERIVHMAGARTPQAYTSGELRALIQSAGRVPVERDSVYREVHRDPRGEWSLCDAARPAQA